MKTQNHHAKASLKLVVLISTLIVIAAGCRKTDLENKGTKGIDKLMSTGNARTGATGLIKGINGHPLNAVAYNANSSTISGITNTQQADMIKEMGLSYYRVDVSTDLNGKALNHTKFLDIINKCAEKGIDILPMIYDKCDSNATADAAYQRGKTQMAGFAQNYGQYIDHFELGNELELFKKLKKTSGLIGDKEAHYKLDKVEKYAQYIRGMEEGLKSVKPTAKSMVNTAGYFPIYWMDRMFAAAPTIDICAWHVYSEMPGAYRSNPDINVDNIHQYLYNRYQRPIWYTETNARSKEDLTQEENEQRSENWRVTFTEQCLAEPNVHAVLYHELLDQPERGTFSGYSYEEENFGYVKFDGYPGKTNEAAYNAWKADPDRYQNWSYKKPGVSLAGYDLVVTDITWSTSTTQPGNTATFTAVITNVGPAATPANVIHGVSFKVDGQAAGCNGSSQTSLAAGASRTLTGTACTRWTTTSGSHTVVATVDDQRRMSERDETNNTRSETFTVSN